MTSGQKAVVVSTIYVKQPGAAAYDAIAMRLAGVVPSGAITLGETFDDQTVIQAPQTFSFVYTATATGNHTFGIEAKQLGSIFCNVAVTQTTVMVIN